MDTSSLIYTIHCVGADSEKLVTESNLHIIEVKKRDTFEGLSRG